MLSVSEGSGCWESKPPSCAESFVPSSFLSFSYSLESSFLEPPAFRRGRFAFGSPARSCCVACSRGTTEKGSRFSESSSLSSIASTFRLFTLNSWASDFPFFSASFNTSAAAPAPRSPGSVTASACTALLSSPTVGAGFCSSSPMPAAGLGPLKNSSFATASFLFSGVFFSASNGSTMVTFFSSLRPPRLPLGAPFGLWTLPCAISPNADGIPGSASSIFSSFFSSTFFSPAPAVSPPPTAS
mmetsp:Transcript_8711/g.21111  ORF Transcript_8711/g.21111 Transcript_8711/m.21111 type:complete len:242 (-) Transcript_8711:1360-2085(-)